MYELRKLRNYLVTYNMSNSMVVLRFVSWWTVFCQMVAEGVLLNPERTVEMISLLDDLKSPLLIVNGENSHFNVKLLQEFGKFDIPVQIRHQLFIKHEVLQMPTIILADNLSQNIANLSEVCQHSFRTRPKLGKAGRIIGQKFPVVVIYDNETSEIIDDMLKVPPIQIHQMIFFVNLDSMEVFETYQVDTYICLHTYRMYPLSLIHI